MWNNDIHKNKKLYNIYLMMGKCHINFVIYYIIHGLLCSHLNVYEEFITWEISLNIGEK